MNIRAVLVGIEKYSGAGVPAVPAGPCRNALDVAGWLTGRGVPAENIHLFLSPQLPLPEDALRSQLPKYGVINDFLRIALPRLVTSEETLLFYWSGHGITITGGQRVVLYQDYSDQTPTYALSLPELSETLSDTGLFKSRRQLLLIDACANRAPNIRPQPQQPRTGTWKKSERYEIHAALEGDYAHNQQGSGEFSRHLLEYLKTTGEWSEPAQFYTGFTKYLNVQDFRPYTAEFVSPDGRSALNETGTAAPGLAPADLLSALERLPISLRELQNLYRRTIEPLRILRLWNVTSIAGMVSELDGLPDNRTLIDFVARANRAAPGGELDDWLARKPATTVRDVEADLDRESMDCYLVMVLADDPMKRGQIASVEAHLYPENFTRPIADYPRAAVGDWAEASRAVAGILENADSRSAGRLHLQFVVSVPLLASAPHEIEDMSSRLVGKNYPAVLRSRDRFVKPFSQVGERWRRRAEEIRKSLVQMARPVPVKPGQPLVKALEDSGIYYLTAPVERQRVYSAAAAPAMMALRDLIDQGVPYLCFIHQAPETDWQPVLESRLNEWLKQGLRGFPARLCDERANCDDYAGGVSVLWDDPAQLPQASPKLVDVK